MKHSKIFFGAFLISAGLLWLNFYFEAIQIHSGELYKYWPVYLIIIGLSMLKVPTFLKALLSFLAGVFTSLLIFAGIIYLADLNQTEKQKIEMKIEKLLERKKDRT